VFSGLPGTGKSTFAAEAARRLDCPLYSKDELHGTLAQSGMGYDRAGWMSYEVMSLLAESQLKRGQSAILDSVTAYERLRAAWWELAKRHRARFLPVECICSDATLHRGRLEERRRGVRGMRELEWLDVETVATQFEPWSVDRLVLDSARPLAESLATLWAYLDGEASREGWQGEEPESLR